MRIELVALSALALAAAFGSAVAADVPATAEPARTKSPAGTELYFITPKNGDKVGPAVLVEFGLKGMGVAPAGVTVDKTGHHHLLIDVEKPPSANEPIPADANHVHFGGGQTQTTITLKPGKHTLQLNLGDALHRQFDPPVLSEKITITVE